MNSFPFFLLYYYLESGYLISAGAVKKIEFIPLLFVKNDLSFKSTVSNIVYNFHTHVGPLYFAVLQMSFSPVC